MVIRVVREADIVLLIVDARMPKLSRNSELDLLANRMNKRIVTVFNKCDLLSNETLSRLRNTNKGSFFVSGTKNSGIDKLRDYLLTEGKKLGFHTTRVGVVGYPNVGKSAIINALLGIRISKVASHAGMTKKIKYGKALGLKIIDTPGVIPFDDKETKLGLIAAKDAEDMKNPERLVIRIIELFLEQNPKSLADFYGVSLENNKPYDLFLEIGKKRGFLMKGGVVDEHRAAMKIIMDWQRGKIKL